MAEGLASDILGELGGIGDICAKANAWGGSGGWAGLIMGILLIILLIWEGIQLANAPVNLSIGVTPSQGTAYLGFAVVVFGLLKFILVVTNEPALGSVDRTDPAARDRVRLLDEAPGAGNRTAAARRRPAAPTAASPPDPCAPRRSRSPVAEGDRAPVVPASRLG